MANEGKIDSVIGKGTTITGDIKVNGSTKIDGSVNGSVNAKESLIVGKGSRIKGDIKCKSAIIGGKVEGNIQVQDVVEFQGGAEMYGDIVCGGIIIETGVFFEGHCSMQQKGKEK